MYSCRGLKSATQDGEREHPRAEEVRPPGHRPLHRGHPVPPRPQPRRGREPAGEGQQSEQTENTATQLSNIRCVGEIELAWFVG